MTRATMLLAYARKDLAPQPRHQKVGRCVDKALQLGTLAALHDLPGRPAQITLEARA